MLNSDTFNLVVKNTPLVSIDLCIICNGQILLGLRNNAPLKGVWFTPGGRILKNEPWADCLKRIAQCELGLTIDDSEHFKLMGVWDHFYENSLLAEDVSTHYVNLPHSICLEHFPALELDEQHNEIKWFSLGEIVDNNIFHEYMRNYASYLLKYGY